eukprot:47997-Prymnesium_polylepis.1
MRRELWPSQLEALEPERSGCAAMCCAAMVPIAPPIFEPRRICGRATSWPLARTPPTPYGKSDHARGIPFSMAAGKLAS